MLRDSRFLHIVVCVNYNYSVICAENPVQLEFPLYLTAVKHVICYDATVLENHEH